MDNLTTTINETAVDEACLAIFWLGQAGFVFKTSSGTVVCVDPYLSDAVERRFGFARMMAPPIQPHMLVADLVVCTHEHLDHMDTDALPVIAAQPRTRFAGPTECYRWFKQMGISRDRCYLLAQGTELQIEDVRLLPVYADHGTLAPDAVGIVFDFHGTKIYHTGDTAYRPDRFETAISMKPDILIPCINGRYGNMNAGEAAQLTKLIGPQVVIPCHFWMFVEHNGDPGEFLEHCAVIGSDVQAKVLKPGEKYLFQRCRTR